MNKTILEQAKEIGGGCGETIKEVANSCGWGYYCQKCKIKAKELLVKAEEACGKSMFETCPRCKEIREILRSIAE